MRATWVWGGLLAGQLGCGLAAAPPPSAPPPQPEAVAPAPDLYAGYYGTSVEVIQEYRGEVARAGVRYHTLEGQLRTATAPADRARILLEQAALFAPLRTRLAATEPPQLRLFDEKTEGALQRAEQSENQELIDKAHSIRAKVDQAWRAAVSRELRKADELLLRVYANAYGLLVTLPQAPNDLEYVSEQLAWFAALYGGDVMRPLMEREARIAYRPGMFGPLPAVSDRDRALLVPLEFPRPTSGKSLASCTHVRQGPNVVVFSCSDASVRVMRPTTLSGIDGILQTGAVVNAAHADQYERGRAVIAGHDQEAVLYENSSGTRSGMLAPIQLDGREVFVSCFADLAPDQGKALCERYLSGVASSGLPEGAGFAGPSLHFAGRTLRVPGGCRMDEGDTIIHCPTGDLHWREQGDHRLPDMYEKVLAQRGRVKRSTVPCRLLGTPAQCAKYVLRAHDGTVVTVVMGLLKGMPPPVVQCNIPSGSPTAYPAPCAQVFAGKP